MMHPPLSLSHTTNHSLRDQKNRLQIDGEDFVPFGFRNLLEFARMSVIPVANNAKSRNDLMERGFSRQPLEAHLGGIDILVNNAAIRS